MAEPDFAVVPPAPSVKQQPLQDKTIDRLPVVHKINATTNSPLQPIHKTNQPFSNLNNDANQEHVRTFEDPHATKPVTTFNDEVIGAQAITTSPIIEKKSIPITDGQANHETDLNHFSSANNQLPIILKDQLHIEQTEKASKFEEMLVDGFAICAFKSWEDLQEELNDRIALEKAKKNITANEQRPCETSLKKKKSKPRQREDSNKKRPSEKPGSHSQSKVNKSKEAKSDKKIVKDTQNKSSSGHSSKSSDDTKIVKKKSKKKEPCAVQKVSGSGKQNVDMKAPSLPSEAEKSIETPPVMNQNDNSEENKSNRQTVVHLHPKHNLQSHNLHHSLGNDSRQSVSQDRILNNDTSRDSDHPSRASPYSPYGNNPHLHRLHEITSNPNHSMQNLHSNSVNPPEVQAHPPNHKHNVPTPPQPPVRPPTAQSSPYQAPYYHTPIYPPQRPSPNVNYNSPYHSYASNHRAPNPYLYHSPNKMNAQQSSNSQPPIFDNNPLLQAPRYPQYPNGYHNQNQQSHYNHPTRDAHPAPPFNIYPPHMHHPQHPNSVVQSMSVSSHQAPYGPPYIITDTTISRQTSIIPPMPTALEQAAASSVASRFGHHPNMIHTMNHYNPAAAAAAATAAAVAQQPNHSSSLYPSPLNPDRGFMGLARGYSGLTGSHSVAPGYPTMMDTSFPPPPAAVPANPYNLDYQRAVSRFIYQSSAPTQSDRAGTLGMYGMRPPPFSTGMFQPPY